MKRLLAKQALLAASLWVFFALPARAADYYACDCQSGAQSGCRAGNDSNGGTQAAPFRTIERLLQQSRTAQCGDTYNVCQGGVFALAGGGGREFANPIDCTANPRQMRSYNPGGMTQRPRLEARSSVVAFNIGGFNEGPSAYGLVLRDFDIRSVPPIGGSKGFYINRGGRGVVLDNLVVDGFDPCVETGSGGGRTQWSIVNSTFRNCSGQGIIGGVASNSTFINNVVEDSACRLSPQSCGFQHSFYWGTNTSITGLIFRGNTFRRSNRVNGACSGAPVTIRGGNGLIFEDNVLDYRDAGGTRDPAAPCYGVRFNQNAGNNDGSEGCQGCIIRRNKIIDADIAIDMQGGRNTLIENNVLSLSAPSTNWCIGMNLQDGGPANGGGPEDITADGATVRNNSIYIERLSGQGDCTGVKMMQSQGSNYAAYSNAVRINSTRPSGVCFDYRDATRFSDDNNLCGITRSGGYGRVNNSFATVTQLQQLLGGCGSSGNGCSSRLLDPGFRSPAAPSFDLTLPDTSPARDTGHPTQSAGNDFTRAARPVGAGPDTGAYEIGASGGGGGTPVALEPPTLLSP